MSSAPFHACSFDQWHGPAADGVAKYVAPVEGASEEDPQEPIVPYHGQAAPAKPLHTLHRRGEQKYPQREPSVPLRPDRPCKQIHRHDDQYVPHVGANEGIVRAVSDHDLDTDYGR